MTEVIVMLASRRCAWLWCVPSALRGSLPNGMPKKAKPQKRPAADSQAMPKKKPAAKEGARKPAAASPEEGETDTEEADREEVLVEPATMTAKPAAAGLIRFILVPGHAKSMTVVMIHIILWRFLVCFLT